MVIDDSMSAAPLFAKASSASSDRLSPKRIVVVSSSPQVRYPDYYGIDMSRMSEFIAFKAAVALLVDRGMEPVLLDVYKKAKQQQALPCDRAVNYVKEIYAPFADEESRPRWLSCLPLPGHVRKWRSSTRHSKGCMPLVPIIRATGTFRVIIRHRAAREW